MNIKKLFYTIMLFFTFSCNKEQFVPAYEIKLNLINKSWVLEYYTDSGEIKSVNDFTINFDKLYTINIFTGGNQNVGSWAVYEGYYGPILQLRYSDYSKDSISLDGNWNISNYTSKRMTLKKDNTEYFLVLK